MLRVGKNLLANVSTPQKGRREQFTVKIITTNNIFCEIRFYSFSSRNSFASSRLTRNMVRQNRQLRRKPNRDRYEVTRRVISRRCLLRQVRRNVCARLDRNVTPRQGALAAVKRGECRLESSISGFDLRVHAAS